MSPDAQTKTFQIAKKTAEKLNVKFRRTRERKTSTDITRIAKALPDTDAQIEKILAGMAWFPYRRLGWFERTLVFITAYDTVMVNFVQESHSHKQGHKEFASENKQFLSFNRKHHPWMRKKVTKSKGLFGEDVEKVSWRIDPSWQNFIKARRSADKRGMIYEDYIAGALIAIKKRGWSWWLTPSNLVHERLLTPQDNYVEATIPGHALIKYEKLPRLTDDDYFRAEQFAGDPLQWDYLEHVILELRRVLGEPREGEDIQRVRSTWTLYQQDGRIPTSVSISDVLKRKSSLNSVTPGAPNVCSSSEGTVYPS